MNKLWSLYFTLNLNNRMIVAHPGLNWAMPGRIILKLFRRPWKVNMILLRGTASYSRIPKQIETSSKIYLMSVL